MTEDIHDPNHRFVPTEHLRASYIHYEKSRNPTAQNYVTLPNQDLEIGIVSGFVPTISFAISSLLTRSLESARCDKGGHLPPEVVKRVQRDIISPEGVTKLWGVAGHRFVLARPHNSDTHEVIATILVGRSKDTIFFFTGRYNNLRYSTLVDDVDFNQPDDNLQHRWFDRFAFPDIQNFKPDMYHHIANFVVSPDHREKGVAGFFLNNIIRYYSKDVLDRNRYPIEHSQHLLCGRGLWQIGDPPWLPRMKKLGFYRRWGAESFFIEHDWAPLPSIIMNGQQIDNVTYNHMYGLPECYGNDQLPYPSEHHLLERVPEVLRLASDPKAKLQYFQAMLDFVPHRGVSQ